MAALAAAQALAAQYPGVVEAGPWERPGSWGLAARIGRTARAGTVTEVREWVAGKAPAAQRAAAARPPRPCDLVAAGLRRDINGGILPPGRRATAGGVAAEYQASRSAAIAALGTLAADGLITQYPGYGYTVQRTRGPEQAPAAGASPVVPAAGPPRAGQR
jgi:hypothetical protein